MCPSSFKQRRTFVLHMKEKHATLVRIETITPSPKTVVTARDEKKIDMGSEEKLETGDDSVVE